MSIQISTKLSICTTQESKSGATLWHWCPGCEERHLIRVGASIQPDAPPAPVWNWDGNAESPTIRPSVKIEWGRVDSPVVCHYTITDGRIEFHTDSTHTFAGYILELPDFPELGLKSEQPTILP